ncbi:hypothetical protein UNSWDHB_2494 [Dehalobacter sp. UNSWDHB]|nr:hypothetical protein UNSWDHB_2494 [Dehalobacter sp. UNSWDHB]
METKKRGCCGKCSSSACSSFRLFSNFAVLVPILIIQALV